ncbi:MAG: AMP-binding protein, partial [Acidimicrobiales bacterium]
MSAHDDHFLSLFNSSDSIIHLDNAERRAPEIATLGRVGAAHLRSLGVEKGARVAIWMANSEQYLVALTACAAGGFVAVSVNTRYSAAEAADLIIRSGAALTLVDGSTPATPPGPTIPAADLMIGDDDHSAAASTDDDHFVVFTTSGTTSKPKMVVHGQRSIAVHARNVATGAGITADDVVLVAMPLCGVFGLCTLTSALAAGSTVVMPTGFDVARTAELIERHQVTITHGSDDMFHRLLEHGADLGSMRWAGYGRFNTSLDGIVERAEASGGRLTG